MVPAQGIRRLKSRSRNRRGYATISLNTHFLCAIAFWARPCSSQPSPSSSPSAACCSQRGTCTRSSEEHLTVPTFAARCRRMSKQFAWKRAKPRADQWVPRHQRGMQAAQQSPLSRRCRCGPLPRAAVPRHTSMHRRRSPVGIPPSRRRRPSHSPPYLFHQNLQRLHRSIPHAVRLRFVNRRRGSAFSRAIVRRGCCFDAHSFAIPPATTLST